MKAEGTGLTDRLQAAYKKERDGQNDSNIWSEKLKRMGENEGRPTLGVQGGENNSSIEDMLSLRYFSGFQVGLG